MPRTPCASACEIVSLMNVAVSPKLVPVAMPRHAVRQIGPPRLDSAISVTIVAAVAPPARA